MPYDTVTIPTMYVHDDGTLTFIGTCHNGNPPRIHSFENSKDAGQFLKGYVSQPGDMYYIATSTGEHLMTVGE